MELSNEVKGGSAARFATHRILEWPSRVRCLASRQHRAHPQRAHRRKREIGKS